MDKIKLNKNNVILVINAGSSNIKFSLIDSETLGLISYGKIDKVADATIFSCFNEYHQQIAEEKFAVLSYESCVKFILNWCEKLNDKITLKCVGHRIVHGGADFYSPVLINKQIIVKLTRLIPLAPLHEFYNIEAIKIIDKLYPKIIQVGCFDTAFHITQNRLATLFAIPRKYSEKGLKRYGFHGLSYEFIASALPEIINTQQIKKVIVAHLGNGSSLCALYELKSVATTMGFTVLDGLMMGTRCGSIDAGLILYLLQEKKLTVEEMMKILYQDSGLLGVSGISGDMRVLLQSESQNANEAINLYSYRVAQEIAAFSVSMHGCDAIVFTAGIGENSPYIRKKICLWLNWLGLELDEDLNNKNATIVSQSSSKILIAVVPTNEEYMIAKHTVALIRELNL